VQTAPQLFFDEFSKPSVDQVEPSGRIGGKLQLESTNQFVIMVVI
jgi:hypothetical protein